MEGAAAFEGEGGECEGLCVRNRSKDGMRCRIECAVDVRRDGGGWGRGDGAGG